MAIEKKLICFARLAEFERQLAAGNILDYSIVFIQDAKKIWNRGTYYDCSGPSDAGVYGDGYIESEAQDDGIYLKTNVAENLDEVSARGQLADAYDIKTFVENAVQGGAAADNVYITDFKVVDFILLKEGRIESLQIDSVALSEAIIAKKTILVPYDEGYVGGYGLLLGETADTELYLSIYTHLGQYIYTEAYNGIVYRPITIIRDLQMECVQQTNLDTLKRIANANAVETDGLLYAFPDQASGEEDDVLLSRGTVKTINGESIVGSGNIEISGGVSQDYVDNAIANAITTTLNTSV